MRYPARVLPIIAILLPFATASAQITLEKSDYEAHIGNHYLIENYETQDTTGVSNILNATGADKTYDFTQLSGFDLAASGDITVSGTPSDFPGHNKSDLQTANMVSKQQFSPAGSDKDTTIYNYLRLESGGYYQEGTVYPF